jgi:predicted DNA-binding protein with PD1-like motif
MTVTLWAEYVPGRRFLARLPNDQDLLKEVAAFCKAASIQMAVFSLVGTVTTVSYGSYDPKQQVYVTAKEQAPFEIVSCSGNVSLKDENPFVQVHGILTNSHGKIIAGQIFSDTVLVAGELDLQELKGKPLERVYDNQTGLMLWQLKEQ